MQTGWGCYWQALGQWSEGVAGHTGRVLGKPRELRAKVKTYPLRVLPQELHVRGPLRSTQASPWEAWQQCARP